MTGGGFLTSAEIGRLLQYYPPACMDIVMEIRGLVAKACPRAQERVLWGGLSYHDPAKGGPVKGAICQIEIKGEDVKLAFIHGVRLQDVDGLMRGSRKSKRDIVIESFDNAPWGAIERLIREAAQLDLDI